MKNSALVVVALLCLTGSASAETDVAASDAKSQVAALARQWETGWNKGDGKMVASLYAEDGTQISGQGVFKGRAAIEQLVAGATQAGARDLVISVDDARSLGNEVWSHGTYAMQVNGQPARGYWSGIDVRERRGLVIMQRLSVATEPGVRGAAPK